MPSLSALRFSQRLRKWAPSTTASNYQYSPLDEEAQEIRLLELLPGTFSSDIRVSLKTTRLTPNLVPDFEALSYAWGSSKDLVNIFIGKSGNHTLAVTKNLAEALPYLRYKDRTRVLWIDAISVNQQDLAERSSQVRRMADIYSNATQVLVWLGTSSNDSSVALECMKLVSSKVNVDWTHHSLFPLSDELHWADIDKELPFTSKELLAIWNVLNRDWFKRLWIWQEVRLAKTAVVMCGTDSISWTAVHPIVFCLRTKPRQTSLAEKISFGHIKLLYELCSTEFSSLLDLIECTKYSLCSDNRDRIFALLSMLIASDEALQIEPDYTKNYLDVYQEIVLRYIKHSRRLNIVAAVEQHEYVAGRPSWVPDWSVPRQTEPIKHGFAGGMSMSQAIFKGAGILQVTGVITAAISVSERFNLGPLRATTTTKHVALELQRMAKRMEFQEFINQSPGNLRKLGRILCANDFASQYSPPPKAGYPSVVDSEITLQAIFAKSSDHHSAIESLSLVNMTYLGLVSYYCFGRSLFKSTDGHIGLGAVGTKPGDLITAWIGCNSPMVLRPTGSGQYLVIGEAYCGGLMDGSAFLGPLPASTELIARHIEGSTIYTTTYINRSTGSFYPEDPRLAGVPLPDGWRRNEHALEKYCSWFVNDSTGEDNGYFDPRLSPEALESRGVKLQVFDLI